MCNEKEDGVSMAYIFSICRHKTLWPPPIHCNFLEYIERLSSHTGYVLLMVTFFWSNFLDVHLAELDLAII